MIVLNGVGGVHLNLNEAIHAESGPPGQYPALYYVGRESRDIGFEAKER